MNGKNLFSISSRLHEIMPILSITLVLLVPLWLRHDPADVPTFGPEQKAVAQMIDTVPFRIGNWAGSDIPVPQAAVQLLRPNAMFSRQYTNLNTGITIDLVIVHCSDARDMLGHYPPVCYPNAGWVYANRARDSSESAHHGQRMALPMHDREVPVALYEFVRMRDWTNESRIRVINFFVLPDGTVTSSIDDVSRRTNWLGSSIHGVAQFQIVSSRSVSLGEVVTGATELLEGMTPLMDTLGVARDE